RPPTLSWLSVRNRVARFLFLVVLADGGHDRRADLADEFRAVLGGPVARASRRHRGTLEVREHVPRHELVALARRLGVGPFMRHVEERAEAAVGLLDQALELGDGV